MPNNTKNPPTTGIESALAWLAGPPAEDSQLELIALGRHLAAVSAATAMARQRHTILQLLQTRASGITNRLKPLLLGATLPLSHRLRVIAQGLIEAHGALAAGFLLDPGDGESGEPNGPNRNQAILCAHAIGHLAEQQEISLLVAAPAPPNLWSNAQAVLRRLRDGLPPEAPLPPDTVAAERTFSGMLALAACQPESCTAKEIAFLVEYLHSFASGVGIRFSPPKTPDQWFWLEEDRDGPPIAIVRRPPPPDGCFLFFTCRQLADAARQQLARLAKGEAPESIGLPSLAADGEYRNVLVRAIDHWAAPRKRHSHRRRNNYRVQVCPHLGTLWQLLGGDTGDRTSREGLPVTDWMVLNESAGGFAMMHVSGDVAGIAPGAAIGLRTGIDPWRLCVIRWARSDNPEHVELGLELIAPAAQAVKMVSPNRDGDRDSAPALLISALPRLNRGETLLAERGRYRDGRFTLISEADGKIQLTECVGKNLAMQTSAVDLFEFERDFSPLATGLGGAR